MSDAWRGICGWLRVFSISTKTCLGKFETARYRAKLHARPRSLAYTHERRVAWHLRLAARFFNFGQYELCTQGGVMSFSLVTVEQQETIAIVTMNRPERRNALSLAHMRELTQAFEQIGEAREAAVVILRGAGPVFCSGHDLSEMVVREGEPEQAVFAELFSTCTNLMETIMQIPQPVIAQIQGVATAAGCQLAATCDLAVASEEARFATPGVKIGLFCSTPMVALSRAVGRKKAMEMLLTGDFITALEAREAGLVNRVVAAAELESATMALAQQIAAASPLVVGIGKKAFYTQIDMPVHDAYVYASEVMTQNAMLEDAQEGMCAFLDKRKPEWRNR
jgi:enoyl-CoA hydratase/carnithine racemase